MVFCTHFHVCTGRRSTSGKKVKQSRYTSWMRLGGEKVQLIFIHDHGTRWGEWTASRPGRAFTPGERTPGTHCTGGWVDPRAGLDTEARGKILCPRRGSNTDRPVVQPVVRHYTAWANPAPGLLQDLTQFSSYLMWFIELSLILHSVRKCQQQKICQISRFHDS
jgi:hypothetical protein